MQNMHHMQNMDYMQNMQNMHYMQIYTTWAAPAVVFLPDRDEGAIMPLDSLIVSRFEREEEQHSAEPNIVYPQLETAFIDAGWPRKHQVLPI